MAGDGKMNRCSVIFYFTLAICFFTNLLPPVKLYAATTDKTIKAEQFILVDKAGNARAGIILENDNPAFFLANKSGKVQSYFALHNDRPMLFFKDKDLNNKLIISIDKSGSPELIFASTNEKPSFAIKNMKNHGVSISFFDSNGNNRLTLGITDKSPSLALIDKNENPRIVLGLTNKDSPNISIQNQAGEPQLTLTNSDIRSAISIYGQNGDGFYFIEDKQAGPVALFRKDGKVAWSVPLLKEKDVPALGPDSDMREMMKGMLK